MILLDTNVLARITNSAAPHCSVARAAVHNLLVANERLAVVPQNFYEFWVVATRAPAQNGLGMSCSQAHQWIRYYQRRFVFLPDRPDLLAVWLDLVATSSVSGFKAHDARLVAAMQTHAISRVLTFNASDFKHQPVTIIDPFSV